MNPQGLTLGIIGFGKLGTALSRLGLQAGYRVVAAASGDPADIALTAEVLTPGVRTAWASDAIDAGDIVVLAVPLHAVRDLPPHRFAGKIVVDATNHWVEVDGPREMLVPVGQTSSEYVQSVAPEARVVKAFGHLGYHDLDDRGRTAGAWGRVAMAIAGDDTDAVRTVAALVDALGFDPVTAGPLARSGTLEPGHPLFGAVLGRRDLAALLGDQQLSRRNG